MTREEAIEYWEQFNAEIDDLYDACSDADRDVLVKQREIVEYTISALRKQEAVTNRNEPLTNAQIIRSMSDEELALWICGVYDIEEENGKFINGIIIPGYAPHDIEEWLQQPAGEEDKHESN